MGVVGLFGDTQHLLRPPENVNSYIETTADRPAWGRKVDLITGAAIDDSNIVKREGLNHAWVQQGCLACLIDCL